MGDSLCQLSANQRSAFVFTFGGRPRGRGGSSPCEHGRLLHHLFLLVSPIREKKKENTKLGIIKKECNISSCYQPTISVERGRGIGLRGWALPTSALYFSGGPFIIMALHTLWLAEVSHQDSKSTLIRIVEQTKQSLITRL